MAPKMFILPLWTIHRYTCSTLKYHVYANTGHYILCIFFPKSVAEESWSKCNLSCVPVGIWNSLPGCMDMVNHLCCKAEHTGGKLPEQVANILDKLGLHPLHHSSIAGCRTHHSANCQGEEKWCVLQEQLGMYGFLQQKTWLSSIQLHLGP